MNKKDLADNKKKYEKSLICKELSGRTIQKYMKDIDKFIDFCRNDVNIDKEYMILYKNFLLGKYKLTSVNSYIIAVNRYMKWLNKEELIIKTVVLEKKNSLDNVITEEEYRRILECAKKKKNNKLYFIMKTLAATGIRVGELKYITYNAIESGSFIACNKGKRRRVYLTWELCELLMEYCDKHDIREGLVFRGRNGNQPTDTTGIWKNMKTIAKTAGVDPKKVYPHNLRHLFAKTYMTQVGNIAELSDILGHSSIETTRIYTLTSGNEKRMVLGSLGL